MAHIHEKVDFTVEVLLVHNHRVLLRKHDKYKRWLSVGGHIELHEDPIETAHREVKEEVGISDIKIWEGHVVNKPQASVVGEYMELVPPVFVNRHHISDTHEHVTFTYIASCNTDKVVEEESEKSAGWAWYSAEELEYLSDLSLHMKHYALTALRAFV